MTNYNNFIQDFPKRCREILDRYENDALSGGREVTLTLAMAASGFVVPYERLRHRKGEPPYPDRGIYKKAASQLDSLLKEKFLGSRLWKEEVSSWSFGNLKSVAEGPDDWPELQERKPLGPNKEVGSTLTHLRNALAHGNIFTFPKDDPDKKDNPDIELIIFLSKPSIKSPKFNFLCVSPQDFQKFLKKWFVFIRGLEIPTSVFSSTVS